MESWKVRNIKVDVLGMRTQTSDRELEGEKYQSGYAGGG